MTFKHIIPLVLIWLSATVCCTGADNQYYAAGSVDGAEVIGPPARPGSAEYEAQMAIVLWLQKTRTQEQVAFVRTPLDLERFAPLIADELLTVDGAELKQLMATIIDEIQTDYDTLKAHYDEERPFIANTAVKPAMDARPVASYPSGHSIRAIVFARILSELFPERRQALMELARQIGYGRVIGGVHFPMDVVAGQKLGNAYVDVIIRQPAFKEAMSSIRKKP